MFGEYNVPEAHWFNENHGIGVQYSVMSPTGLLVKTFDFYNFCQGISHPNSRAMILDLLLANFRTCEVQLAIDFVTGNFVFHIGYSFSFNITPLENLHHEDFFYDFKNANNFAINDFLAQ